MTRAAHIPQDTRGKVAIEDNKLATQLDGLNLVTSGGKLTTRDDYVNGSNLKWATHLRIFREAGMVKEEKDRKTGDRGKAMMFIGYPFI